MSEKEFKVGDWVSLKMGDFQAVGIITEKAELGYVVKANNSYFQYVLEEYMERIDPKTAFLRDLSELLRKHNAEISAYSLYENAEIEIKISNNESFVVGEYDMYRGSVITADNVLNYDK